MDLTTATRVIFLAAEGRLADENPRQRVLDAARVIAGMGTAAFDETLESITAEQKAKDAEFQQNGFASL